MIHTKEKQLSPQSRRDMRTAKLKECQTSAVVQEVLQRVNKDYEKRKCWSNVFLQMINEGLCAKAQLLIILVYSVWSRVLPNLFSYLKSGEIMHKCHVWVRCNIAKKCTFGTSEKTLDLEITSVLPCLLFWKLKTTEIILTWYEMWIFK